MRVQLQKRDGVKRTRFVVYMPHVFLFQGPDLGKLSYSLTST